jgi:Putative restriction endonuclease
MSRRGRVHRYTYADYVGVEMSSSTKHEFVDGEIYAMAGSSADHAALAVRVLAALENSLGDGPCRAYSSDLRLYVESSGLATFPDGSVICGPVKKHPPGADDSARSVARGPGREHSVSPSPPPVPPAPGGCGACTVDAPSHGNNALLTFLLGGLALLARPARRLRR